MAPRLCRVTRWSEASEDIRALRKMLADGPLACEESSRLLVAASLSAAMVKNDDQGSGCCTDIGGGGAIGGWRDRPKTHTDERAPLDFGPVARLQA